MGVLTKEQLDQVWNEAGLKFNMGRFHGYLLERGLLPYVNLNNFREHVYRLLHDFFVLGMKEDKDGRQQLPADPKGK